MEEQIQLYILLRTQSKQWVLEFKESPSCEINYILLKIINQQYKDNNVTIQYDCCDVCHVLTKDYNNKYQYLLPLYENLGTLLQRQVKHRCDKDFIYLYISERHFPYVQKYKGTTNSDVDKAKNNILRDIVEVNNIFTVADQEVNRPNPDYFHISDDPFSNCVNEMRSTYPLPSIIPIQLIKKHFNRYLDDQKTNFSIKLVKDPPITPTAINPNMRTVSLDTYLLQIIVRSPLIISYLFYPFTTLLVYWNQAVQKVLHTQPYFYPSKVPSHRNRMVLVLRIPIFPNLIRILVNVVVQTILYVGFSMINITIKNIVRVFKMLIYLHLAILLICQCQFVLAPSIIITRTRQKDPTGQMGYRFHYLFDELYRVDNQYRHFGTYNRNQYARNFKSLKIRQLPDRNIKNKFLRILVEFIKSIDPEYELPQ